MSNIFYETITDIVPAENVIENEPMCKHTSFRLGGPARWMILIDDEEQLAKVVSYLRITEKPFFLLGNGSNLLVSDRGYNGIVLKLSEQFRRVEVHGNQILAGAGALMSAVAAKARDAKLTGLEFASGIPGTIGGGVVMNAGAYGGEMKQVVETVKVLTPSGEYAVLDRDVMEFGYRTSAIRNKDYIVVEVTFSLQDGEYETIADKMEEMARMRKEKQPLEYPSAGSFFKRPEGYFAGKLIMDAGFRGYRIGGAQVSEKHCGFIINAGGATASDVRDLMIQVQERVKEMFHVELEQEVIFLGEF